ncbi:MAG: putative sugar O-methyltransferase [Gammaproteobacteria bacterium]|nr:putative sugar O-methyltransferase [Gammaproteobacteria bacterium]
MSAKTRQLEDSPELFESMMVELENSPQKYQPTNYWSKYISETVRLIREEGLKDFRRQKWGYFRSFGASDFASTSEYQRTFLRHAEVAESDKNLILDYLDFVERHPEMPVLPFNIAWQDIDQLAARSAELTGKVSAALPMMDIEPDPIGNPLHDFGYKGKTYTHYFLNYYMRYAAVNRFIDFNKVDNIVELGSGVGNQVEILKKYYPHLTFYLLDLAPYLYVCHQFLAKLFPECHVPYQDTAEQQTVSATRKGDIIYLGNGRLNDLRPKGVTLFWNSASFGEMEPEVVENYIQETSEWADGVYLYQVMAGKELGSVGKGGVLKKTTFEHYQKFLGQDYSLVDRSHAESPLSLQHSSIGHDDAIWVKSGAPGSGMLRKKPITS